MNTSYLVFLDFETGSRNPATTQPTQLAAIIVDPSSLEPVENAEFNSLMRPLEDEEAIAYGLDPIENDALDISHLTREELKKAPPAKLVWQQFSEWINWYNTKGGKWEAPILCGYNIINFDGVIINRLAGGHRETSYDEKTIAELLRLAKDKNSAIEDIRKLAKKITKLKEPYGFGPWNKERQRCSLFHTRDALDLMHLFWYHLYENSREYESLSFDNARDYLGLTRTGAHNALTDCRQGVQVMARFMKYIRKHAQQANFKGSFKR